MIKITQTNIEYFKSKPKLSLLIIDNEQLKIAIKVHKKMATAYHLLEQVKRIRGIFDYFDIIDLLHLHLISNELNNLSDYFLYPIEFKNQFIKNKVKNIELYWRCFEGVGTLKCGESTVIANLNTNNVFHFLSVYGRLIQTITLIKNINGYEEYQMKNRHLTFDECLDDVFLKIYFHIRSQCAADVEIIEIQETFSKQDKHLLKMLMTDDIFKYLNSHDRLNVFEAFHRTLSIHQNFLKTFMFHHIHNFNRIFQTIKIFDNSYSIDVVIENGYKFYCEYLSDIINILSAVKEHIKFLEVITNGESVRNTIKTISKIAKRWLNLERIIVKVDKDNIEEFEKKMNIFEKQFQIPCEVIEYYGCITHNDNFQTMRTSFEKEYIEIKSMDITHESFNSIATSQFQDILLLPNLLELKMNTWYENLKTRTHIWDFLATNNKFGEHSRILPALKSIVFINKNRNDWKSLWYFLNELKNITEQFHLNKDLKLLNVTINNSAINKDLMIQLCLFQLKTMVFVKCVFENDFKSFVCFNYLTMLKNVTFDDCHFSSSLPIFSNHLHTLNIENCKTIDNTTMIEIYHKCSSLKVNIHFVD